MTDSKVWIRSEPSTDGSTYVVALETSDDQATVLTPARALAYAQGVLAAAHRAEYDAAVYKQLSTLISDKQAVGQVIADLRDERPPLDPDATAPLRLEPGVSVFTGEPFLSLFLDGKQVGQWGYADARDHAVAVLEVVAVADLDGGYYRALTETVGVDEGRARNVITDLVNHRDQQP